MNNLYHKVAVTSICTALSFTLVTNKEAKAATFNLIGTSFSIGTEGLQVGSGSVKGVTVVGEPTEFPQTRAFYEFDISKLSLASNTIKRATLNTPFINLQPLYRFLDLAVYQGKRILSITRGFRTITRLYCCLLRTFFPPVALLFILKRYIWECRN
jgi:hypothetical protein